MIRLADGWAIDTSKSKEYYVIGIPYDIYVEDKKTGEKVRRTAWKQAKYPWSLNRAIEMYSDMRQKELVADREMTLVATLFAFRELDKEIVALFRENGLTLALEEKKND